MISLNNPSPSTRQVICIKTYERKDPQAIIPNSVDEDIRDGPEKFLFIKSDRQLGLKESYTSK